MRKIIQVLFFQHEEFATIEESISFKILFVSILNAIIGIPVSFAVGSITLLIASIVVIIFYLFLLYLFKYKRNFELVRNIFIASGYIFLILLWFQDAGIEGATGMFWVSLAALTPLIVPQKYQKLALGSVLIAIVVLSLIDYFYNHLIVKHNTPEALYIENIVAYATQAFFLFLIVKFFRETYNKNLEKLRAKELEIVQKNQLLEEKNQHLQEMVENNRRLFSIVSHDIRGPIASSKALLKAVYQGEIEIEQLRELIPDMYRNFRFTLSLVDNLLFWAKSQFDEFKPNARTFNLNEFLYSLVEGFSLIAQYKSIKLEIDIPQKPIFINFDGEILEIVIRNIFSNAVKFSHFEGTISISCFRKGAYLYTFIIDNGVGIAPEDLEKIKKGILFSHKGTDYEKGTGLGLSLCQNLLNKCDASLEIESAFGRGTGICIKIPVKYLAGVEEEKIAPTQDLSTN